jgi:hypothetical protein
LSVASAVNVPDIKRLAAALAISIPFVFDFIVAPFVR